MKTQDFAQNRRIESALDFAPVLSKNFEDWLVKYSNYDEEKKKIRKYLTQTVFDINSTESYEKCVIEFISGMTDNFARTVFEEIISF